MNGSVVPMVERPTYAEIKKKVDALHDVFYNGDPQTDFEQDLERMYVNEKHEKVAAYSKRKSLRYKVRWTVSDLNRHQD